MEHYSTNAQNRKLKKQILNFLSRIGFAGGSLPASGKVILFLTILLFISLFMPWISISNASSGIVNYSAFNSHLGYIGVGIALSISIIGFFLLSHTKKEQVRAYVPFRLSDTQAIIFITSMTLVAVIQLLILLPIYKTLGDVEIKTGFILAGTCLSVIIICGFYLSRSIKSENTESYYLNKDLYEKLGEYKNIIQPDVHAEKERKKRNMSLPI